MDYLLKPIDAPELVAALQKFDSFYQRQALFDCSGLEKMLQTVLSQKTWKERFLVKTGQQLTYVPINEIAYFFSEDGIAFLQCRNGKKYITEFTLDQLEGMLDPA